MAPWIFYTYMIVAAKFISVSSWACILQYVVLHRIRLSFLIILHNIIHSQFLMALYIFP
ncbi:hypothetical protein V8F33_005553 [Rhypophila sp. PSN 637]